MQAAAAVGNDVSLARALVDDEQRKQALQTAREAFRALGEVLFDQPGGIAPALGGERQPGAEIGDPDFTVGGTGDVFVGSFG